MNFIQVSSSNLYGVMVEGNNLIIKFKSGGVYSYTGAACELGNLLNSSSKGKYLNNYIKPFYHCDKLS